MKESNQEVLDKGSLPQMLVARARHSSDRRLVLDAALGLIAASAIAILQPPLWIPLGALAFCVGAFGLWGILDRELTEGDGLDRRVKVLTAARGLVALAGGLVAILFGVTLFFGLLGTWIS